MFLLNYRATPHCTTKVPPATALFVRNIRTKLSQQPSRVSRRRVNKQIDEADAETKLKSKSYADQRRGAKQPNFKVGDQVLVRQQKRNKLTSKFNPRPYQIIKIKATMITARRGEHQVTRNCSHFKLFTGNSNTELSVSDNESDVSVEDNAVGQPSIEVGQGRGEPRREIEEPVVEHRDGQQKPPFTLSRRTEHQIDKQNNLIFCSNYLT